MTWTYAIDDLLPLDDRERLALLGGKGAHLAIMAGDLGLPVPPAFVITTDVSKALAREGWPAGLDEEIATRMSELGRSTGRRFGDATEPLTVSVRSGAPASMPGMLDTILNVGLNDATTEGLARASVDPAFASACRTRLRSMYRESVGVETVPDDPWQQLRGAIEAVLRSWDGDRARSYREREGIDHAIGTAVVVQAMVYGNASPDSATGVLFTRDPASGDRSLYGDVLFGAQGEDVVSGSRGAEPIAVLDERLPAVAAELRRYADLLERHHRDACDIEFTIERGRLWLLQNRVAKRTARAALRMAVDMAEDADFPLSRGEAVARVADILVDPPLMTSERDGDVRVVARGLPASPGLAAGVIATSAAAAVARSDRGQTVLLVRTETSPDDVHGMARSAGILTATGGVACHAAVVARGWDIPAVVGASAVVVHDGAVRIGDRTYAEGDVLSIDGSTGEVFEGPVDGVRVVVPEAATLMGWARELSIAIGTGEVRSEARRFGSDEGPEADVTTEEALRALSIKGYVTPELMAPALRTTPEKASSLLELLVKEGLAELGGGMHRLTDGGKAAAVEALAVDRERWGADRAAAALDAFLELDSAMKHVVTAWQMREVAGQPVLNDHADADYDARVLADMAALHAEATAWLMPVVDGLPRLESYRERLDEAARRAAAGEHAYIASPRVDSYHSVWFELHEDLIRLAGRTREDEVACGRA